jgi:hypothetical protein
VALLRRMLQARSSCNSFNPSTLAVRSIPWWTKPLRGSDEARSSFSFSNRTSPVSYRNINAIEPEIALA